MRFSTTTALALTSIMSVSALPAMTKRQATDIDADILQYALTVGDLIHLYVNTTNMIIA
jgi:hypothetical protein